MDITFDVKQELRFTVHGNSFLYLCILKRIYLHLYIYPKYCESLGQKREGEKEGERYITCRIVNHKQEEI